MKTVYARYALIAAAMAHVEGYYSSKSPANRNNNPGNIERDGVLRRYDAKQIGWEALNDDIQANDHLSLASFLHKYAPDNENDTDMYIRVVSQLTGIDPLELIGS